MFTAAVLAVSADWNGVESQHRHLAADSVARTSVVVYLAR
jgi:hypothetical protein